MGIAQLKGIGGRLLKTNLLKGFRERDRLWCSSETIKKKVCFIPQLKLEQTGTKITCEFK